MKAFRFRAETLLTLRKRQEDAARTDLLRAQAVASEAAAEMDRAWGKSREAAAGYCAAMREGLETATIERHRNWIVYLQGAAHARQRTHDDRQADVAKAVRIVQEAHRQVRMLERLRDRAERRYAAAVRLEESKEMDQFAATQFARRAVEGGVRRGH